MMLKRKQLKKMNKEKNEKGKTFAYIRVSSPTQNLESQKQVIENCHFKVDRIFEDTFSGKNLDRPGFKKLWEMIREEDWIVVTSLDRIGRSLTDLNAILTILNEKKIRLISLKENFDFSSNSGKFLFHIMGAVAEYERNLIKERQKIGIEEAKKRGVYKGRKRIAIPKNFEHCLDKYLKAPRVNKYTLKMFAQETGLSVSTLCNFIKRQREHNNTTTNLN